MLMARQNTRLGANLLPLSIALGLSLGGLALPGTARAVKNSYNANHPDLEWYSIDTPHFVVHYPKSKKGVEEGNEHYINAEYSARKAAEVAELMWEPMCANFNYYLKEKVHIVMLDQGDELAGFTIPSWDWIQISANPGASFSRQRGRMEWFSDVLVHEFAHVVSLKAYRAQAEGAFGVALGGLYSDGVSDVSTGANFMISDGDSVFWTEGGAEYWSNTAGWNWWTASRDQFIRMTVLEDRLLTFDEWHERAGKWGWNDGERYYQQGYSFGLYLRQRFGSETYARFAAQFAQDWRPEFSTVIEDVVGVPAEELYWDWREYVTKQYTDQHNRVKARGEVMGRELVSGKQAWDYANPDERDTFLSKSRWDREKEREATGAWQFEPRTHPDGKYWGNLNRGMLVVKRQDDDQIWALTGLSGADQGRKDETARLSEGIPATFEFGWDFIPGQEALVLTMMEDEYPKTQRFAPKFEFNGYNMSELAVYTMPVREEDKKGRAYSTRGPETKLRKQVYAEGAYQKIPNTKRGNQPAVSPDGQRVAYLEYRDGGHNLVSIKLDGSDKRYLTNFNDGTWMNNPDWSPDGSQIVFAMFRNFQQNLYVMNADGTGLRPLTWDAWEELDPHWSKDGGIYFTAEPDGIFNIYRIDPASHDVRQITNVIGGAVTPSITSEGNLVYSYLTSFGWKIYGLPREQFMNAPAGHLFRTPPEVEEKQVEQSLAYREDLTKWEAATHKHKMSAGAWSAPYVVPMFRLENDSQTDFGLQGGWQGGAQDFIQNHEIFHVGLLGEDNVIGAGYTWHGWYPDVSLFGQAYMGKSDFGYKIDEDQDPTTTDDQTIYDIKQNNRQAVLSAEVMFPWNNKVATTVYGRYFNFGFRGTSDSGFQQYMQNWEVGTTWAISDYGINTWDGALGANAFYGRNIDLGYAHAWTDIIYPDYGGVITDDGEVLGEYQFNRYEFRWVEQARPPRLWGLMDKARKNRHTIQIDFQAGIIDRNVGLNDEFRAGGRHPYFWGYGVIRPNTQFAGYPFFSLNGETMGTLNLAYRFPISQSVRTAVGPLFIYGVYAQLGGTAGNLWSFTPPSNSTDYYRDRAGDRIARDPNDVKREIPFVDVAHKNGNAMLYDLQAELRVQSTMFHSSNWDSFLRFAYALNEIRGYGDVDGDGVFDTSPNAIGDELSNETEKPGLRVYIGLGTGW
ncbi:MAG: PD40 domain-containing protein [Deltaproteobacteria bacterium]|nr:PD40 domain-containing protein [Deltaproteobacteria bacterium]